jgi:hypothetical protein
MTFSINHLGNNGHLGNQMFQYAFVKSMSIKHSRSFYIPPKSVFGKYYYQKLFSNIDECFDIKCNRSMTEFPSVTERFFHFDDELFENPPEHDVNYVGFFQSEKYFKNIESELRTDFTFKDDILNTCKEVMSEYDQVIGIHIRRNDFLTNPNHPVQPNSYYEKALSEFDDHLTVMVFSDDPEWCIRQKIFESDRFMVSETNDAYIDLCLLSLCSHHIICNSTFSWWGAWLADSKNVIAPKAWFSGDCKDHNTKDLYLKDWKKL